MARVGAALMERARAVRVLMDEYDHVDKTFVQTKLGLGPQQAVNAIRQARFQLADEGYRVSYANAANDYTVAKEGPAPDRLRSYASRQQSMLTQRRNHARVAAASANSPKSQKLEWALGQLALADQGQADVDQIRLDTIKALIEI